MLVMELDTNDWNEKMAVMNSMLEKVVKDSKEKEDRIKL